MRYNRLHCTTAFIGTILLACLGCESSSSESSKTVPPNTANSAAQASTPSAESVAFESEKALTQETAPSEAAKASPSKAPQVVTEATKLPLAKPTADQLVRWKQTTYEPFQLLAYMENDKVGSVSFVAATSDGKQYLLGGTRLTLWNLEDQVQAHEFIDAKTEAGQQLTSFAVSPGGQWCVVGDASGLLRKFDITNGRELASQQGDANRVNFVAISSDGAEIATIGTSSEVAIWDAETFQKKSSFKSDASSLEHLQYISSHELVVAGDSMSSWDTSTGQKIKKYPSERNQTAIALSPDGKEFIFGTDGALQRWSMSANKEVGRHSGVPARNATVQYSPNGSLIAVATPASIHIISAATGQILQVIDASGAMVSDICWVPQTELLLVATDAGRTRIWGRPNEGKSLGLTTLQDSMVTNDTNADEPASFAENLRMIDLRALSKLPEARPQSDTFDSVNYSAPVAADEASTYYRYILGEKGWSELVQESTDSPLTFQKSGHVLNVASHVMNANESFIYLTYLGNYDLRKTPKLSAIQKESPSLGRNSVSYKVSANLLDIETELLESLHKVGWTAAVRLLRSRSQKPDERDLEFVRNGTLLRVSVQRDKDDPALFNVRYTQSLSRNSLPVPADAGLMEWDDFSEPQMVANTSLNLQQATAFYEKAMLKQGWVPRNKGRRIDKDLVYLPYYWGQRDITIALESIPDGMTRIRAGKYSENSWQKPEQQTTQSQPASEPLHEDKIEAADFPILHSKSAPKYDSARGSIAFEVNQVTLPALSKEYTTALGERGWETNEFEKPKDDYVILHFTKGDNIIYYSSSVDPLGVASVTINGNGIAWSKAITSKQVVPYAVWLENNKLPSTLKFLDEYHKHMEPLQANTKVD